MPRAHAAHSLIGSTAGAFALVACSIAGACHTPVQTAGLAAAGATAFGGQAPTQEIEQIYYVGTFDPLGQLPPAVYRLTVHGQGSAISQTRFASGWVPASLIDTLGTSIQFDSKGRLQVEPPESQPSSLQTGRRQMMFGPEGFREAPSNHRLVIVMGSSPEKFFAMIGKSLEKIARVQQEQLGSGEAQRILEELYRLQDERIRLNAIEAQLALAAASVEEGQ